jgi:nitric oxide reductase activation protein
VDLQQAEAEMRKAGKPVANLYNPRSTDYFGNTLDKYRRNPKEIMRETIQDMRRTSTGNGLDFTKSKSATIQRREGESYEAYIKRRREGGG